MQEQVEFWYWLILGVAFIALEIFAPGAILMWFGFGALITGFVLWVFPDMALALQILLFALVSGISVLLWRQSKFFREEATPSDDPTLNNRLNSHIGKEYTLTEAIVNGRGAIRFSDSNWRVQGKDMPAGTRVRIIAVDGIQFIVEKT